MATQDARVQGRVFNLGAPQPGGRPQSWLRMDRFAAALPAAGPAGGRGYEHGQAAAGFTLIELLIAVGIVGILAAVAYPAYVDQVRRSNRAEAKGVLMENAQFFERNYTLNNCYHRNDAACTTAASNITAPPIAQSPAKGTAKYTITVAYDDTAPCTKGQCFTLSATPTGTMAGDRCGSLTLNQAGILGTTGDYDRSGTAGDEADVAACWAR